MYCELFFLLSKKQLEKKAILSENKINGNVLFLPLLISQEISFFGHRELKLLFHACKTRYTVTASRERFYLSYLTLSLKNDVLIRTLVFSLCIQSLSLMNNEGEGSLLEASGGKGTKEYL